MNGERGSGFLFDPDPGKANLLLENLAVFVRLLRGAGLKVGTDRTLLAAQVLRGQVMRSRGDCQAAMRSLLVRRAEDLPLFDQAFALFFQRRSTLETMIAALSPQVEASKQVARKPLSRRLTDELAPQNPFTPPQPQKIEQDFALTLSDQEKLQRKDFEQMSATELEEAARQIAGLRFPDDRRKSLRRRPAKAGRGFDLRATLKAARRSGGEPLHLLKKKPVEQSRPLVVLVDISGSMARYSRLFLRFLHALARTERPLQVFLFGTRLTLITRDLAWRDADEALEAVSARVLDWSGGTLIGASLTAFNRNWARRTLGQGANVLLLSDGLERSGIEVLGREMALLRRSCHQLIWLNPLLRFEGFSPEAAGIKTMLKEVDKFLPMYNLESIRDLSRTLGKG